MDLIFEEPSPPALRDWLSEIRNHPECWVKYPKKVPEDFAETIDRDRYDVEFRNETTSFLMRPTYDLYVLYFGI